MKIIHLISGSLGQGGAERLVMDLASAQAELEKDVSICCFRQYDSTQIDISDKVKLHTFNKTIGVSPTLTFRIAKYIKSERPDVVNCHLPAVFPYLIWPLLMCKDVKFFYTVHSNPQDEEPRKVVRILRKMFIESGKLTFIGISSLVGKCFTKQYGLNSGIPVICNGRKTQQPTESLLSVKREVEELKQNDETRVFLAVGRLTREKNYVLMLAAFRKLQDENVTLVALGKDYDCFLERHRDDIPSNVHFLGSKDNVIDYLSIADCFIMSSLYEGSPIAIIEAMSAGLPIVSTSVGGVPDMVTDGVNGFLSDSLEVNGFVKAIKRYLSADQTDLSRISESNRMKYASVYDIKKTAEQYISLYRRHQTR